MTTTDLLLNLKYHFRDYFIPVEGKSRSLIGVEDLITNYIENNYSMKISFQINKEKIVALNQVLSVYDRANFETAATWFKPKLAMRKELRSHFVRKTIDCNETKSFKVSLPYYLASELYTLLAEHCIDNDTTYFNGLDQLKNTLHQKLL